GFLLTAWVQPKRDIRVILALGFIPPRALLQINADFAGGIAFGFPILAGERGGRKLRIQPLITFQRRDLGLPPAAEFFVGEPLLKIPLPTANAHHPAESMLLGNFNPS